MAYTPRDSVNQTFFNPSFASQGQVHSSRLCQEKYKGVHPLGIFLD
jgi:hypothetical protein